MPIAPLIAVYLYCASLSRGLSLLVSLFGCEKQEYEVIRREQRYRENGKTRALSLFFSLYLLVTPL